jgi:acetylornithine deacetylase/succinyl-diaminopimelate desuccinylase-like protein
MRLPESALCAALVLLAPMASAQSPGPALAREVLRDLVSIRTVHPDGDNTAAARAAARRLLEAGFDPADVQVLEPAPLKGNLVARLRGSGEARPMLLLAHIDVVDALREGWSQGLDPWVLTERDGWLYGRGVLDDKGSAAHFVAVLAQMKREGYRPRRDIILALTADEEGGTHNGMRWLLERHRALVDAEFALNEGGFAEMRAGRRIALGIQVAEKSYQSFTFEAANRGGHSSLPVPDNAIYDLAAALDRLSRLTLPARIGPVVRGLGAREAQGKTGPRADAMRALAAGEPSAADLALISENAGFNAQLRTTCVATRLDAGTADNALPQRATATVNCRLLPSDSSEFVQAELEKVAGPRVKVSPKNPLAPSPESDPKGAPVSVVERVAKQRWPGVQVFPTMSAGGTDSRHLRGAGIPTYGVQPLFMELDDYMRAHGRDERIAVKSFDEGFAFFDGLIRELASGP